MECRGAKVCRLRIRSYKKTISPPRPDSLLRDLLLFNSIMHRLIALCLLVAVCGVLCEGVTSKQASGVTRRRPPGPVPSPVNRIQRAGPPSRMRNLAKRAHHNPPAKRGYFPQHHRVPYSKPFPQRKAPKYPPYNNKPHKPAYSKFGAPHKGYNRPPKTSYESYSKPQNFGSFSANNYHQPKPYLPSSYQYNPPQGASFSTQTSSSKFANQAPGYSVPSFAASQGSQPHSSSSPQAHSPMSTQTHPSLTAQSHSSLSAQTHTPQSSPVVASTHISSSSYSAPASLSSYSSSGTSYSVGTGSHQASASTTYGVPHPTHGAPQPPSYASYAAPSYSKDLTDQATSYVHFYQGNEAPKDSQNLSPQANTYTYSSTHYTENKHKGSVFDSDLGGSESKSWNHQETKDKRATEKSKDASGSFKAPKQTYGFLPYDTDSTRQSDKESNYNQGYYTDSVLSPNYYEQQPSSS